jgi:hypothetical protein
MQTRAGASTLRLRERCGGHVTLSHPTFEDSINLIDHFNNVETQACRVQLIDARAERQAVHVHRTLHARTTRTSKPDSLLGQLCYVKWRGRQPNSH